MKKFIFFLTMQLIFISNVYTMEKSSDSHKNELESFQVATSVGHVVTSAGHDIHKNELTLLQVAASDGQDIHKDGLKPLWEAASKDHKMIIELLLNGSSLNHGNTLLYLAARNANNQIVNLLLISDSKKNELKSRLVSIEKELINSVNMN